MTAQGVLDLNHTGPKVKREASPAAESTPTSATPGTVDDAGSEPASIAPNDQAPSGSGDGNG